jgi:hypothetical protein
MRRSIGWITDLSAPDPYYVLPVLMGVSMIVADQAQRRRRPDPIQAKVMQIDADRPSRVVLLLLPLGPGALLAGRTTSSRSPAVAHHPA